jgi:Tfp pilus assembly PilM family ATPase
MNFYQDHYPSHSLIKKIFISGGGSNVKHLKKIISDHLDLEVLDGDVFLKISGNIDEYNKKFTETHNLDSKLLKSKRKKGKKGKKTETISSKHNSSLNYATVIGLALRDV